MTDREIACLADRACQAFTAMEYHQGCVAKLVESMNDSKSCKQESELLHHIEIAMACMKDGEAIAESIYKQYLHCTYASTKSFHDIDGCNIRKVLLCVMNHKNRAHILETNLNIVRDSLPGFVAGLCQLYSTSVDCDYLHNNIPKYKIIMSVYLNNGLGGSVFLTQPTEIDAMYSGDVDQIKKVIQKCGNSKAQSFLQYLPANAVAFVNEFNVVDFMASRRR